MNNKRDLLNYKKALLAAAMSSMVGLTACSAPLKNNNGTVTVSNDIFTNRMYLDDNGNVVYEIKPEKHLLDNGKEIYTVPNGYMLTFDEYGNPIGRKVIKKESNTKTR